MKGSLFNGEDEDVSALTPTLPLSHTHALPLSLPSTLSSRPTLLLVVIPLSLQTCAMRALARSLAFLDALVGFRSR